MVQLPESSSSIEGKVKWLRASSIGMWKNTCEASHNETAAPIFDRGGGFALMPRADVLVIRQVIIGAPSLISSEKFQILSLVPFQVDSNPL